MKALHFIAYILLWIGGLNWLLYAFDFNVVNKVFGAWQGVETVIYILVGVAAIYTIATHKKDCKVCGGMAGGM